MLGQMLVNLALFVIYLITPFIYREMRELILRFENSLDVYALSNL